MLDVFGSVLIIIYIYFNVYSATNARRNIDTEVGTQARRARDIRGIYVLFKCLYNQTYCIYNNNMCLYMTRLQY